MTGWNCRMEDRCKVRHPSRASSRTEQRYLNPTGLSPTSCPQHLALALTFLSPRVAGERLISFTFAYLPAACDRPAIRELSGLTWLDCWMPLAGTLAEVPEALAAARTTPG